jgi:glycosyltransferase involved in cell wall biosynthesis
VSAPSKEGRARRHQRGLEPVPSMRVGVDASNLRGGGGITHLVELLKAAEPGMYGIASIIVWAPDHVLERIEPRPWLKLAYSPLLNGPLPARLYWQHRVLGRLAAKHADVLFVPGGRFAGNFRPFVTMSRNLLPFDREAARLFGARWMGLKLIALRRAQTTTFRSADGVIFLNAAAQRSVEAVTGVLAAATKLVPHGVSTSFRREPTAPLPLDAYTMERPFRWLYVSTIDLYKHQDRVALATAALRAEGLPICLDLVGPAYRPALKRLRSVLGRIDPGGSYIRHLGGIDHAALANVYAKADGFVFASSCENMPNVLIEAMAAGLPIACSSRSVMPEVLQGGGVYFDPLNEGSIADAMRSLTKDPELRSRVARTAHARAYAYTWQRCADETLEFLAGVAQGSRIGG